MFNNRNIFSTVAAGAKPENNMQAPNYKIQGPIADHTQQPSAFQKAATTAGASVLGKAGEAALFGVPAAKGAATSTAIPGMWGTIAPAVAGLGPVGWGLGALMAAKTLFNKGGSVGPLSPQYKEDGGEIASLKEYLQELYARADAGEGWANDEIEATLIKIKELEAQGFNKGGKAKPMYAGEGSYTFPSVNWVPWYGGTLGMLEDEAKEHYLNDDFYKPSRWEQLGYDKMFPVFKGLYMNKGGSAQHKEHGGMTGPLSNNKSVKMEKKETIEYKN